MGPQPLNGFGICLTTGGDCCLAFSTQKRNRVVVFPPKPCINLSLSFWDDMIHTTTWTLITLDPRCTETFMTDNSSEWIWSKTVMISSDSISIMFHHCYPRLQSLHTWSHRGSGRLSKSSTNSRLYSRPPATKSTSRQLNWTISNRWLGQPTTKKGHYLVGLFHAREYRNKSATLTYQDPIDTWLHQGQDGLTSRKPSGLKQSNEPSAVSVLTVSQSDHKQKGHQ